MTSCVYCRENKPFTDEHVLSRAFAGQEENWTLQDMVCGDCNQAFSICERAWTGAPGEAMARIYHGPAGRKRKGQRYRIHPAEHVYLITDGHPIAYEAEILDGIDPRLRPQIIWTGNELVAVAAEAADATRLQGVMNDFIQNRELTVYKHPNLARKARFLVATLGTAPNQASPCLVGYEWRQHPTTAWLDRFPYQPARTPFLDRASVDQDDRFRIRAENLEMAIHFLREIQNKVSTRSGQLNFAPGAYRLHVEHRYEYGLAHRAVAKTGFNLALKILGRNTMEDSGFDRCRTYCWSGVGNDEDHPFVGILVEEQIAGMPVPIRNANADHHVLMLLSNGERLIALVRLYGGPVYRIHLGVRHMEPFQTTAIVDYNGNGITLL